MKRKSLAIPIRIAGFSDSSQVVRFLTREQGIVEAIAKGAHRERNAFQGPFDLAVLWEIVFVERPAERGLSIVTEGIVLDPLRGLRASWRRWSAAAFVLEWARFVGTSGPEGELFDHVLISLRALTTIGIGAAEEAGIALALVTFESRALRLLGFLPPLSSCAACERPWSRADRPVFFAPESGGILCGKCQAKEASKWGRLVPGHVVRSLDQIACGGPLPESSREASVESGGSTWLTAEDLSELERLLARLRSFHLDDRMGRLQYAPQIRGARR